MALDPRTPVVVGGGQVNQRTDDGDPVLEPVDLIAAAARQAEADSGGRGLLAALDSIRLVQMLSWRYRDPGALVAERIGAAPRHSGYSTAGGNTPQSLLNQAALDIAAGRADVVLIGGAEAWRTRMRFRATDERPAWTVQDDAVPAAEVLGTDLAMFDPIELNRGIAMPVQVYPMFEQALRIRAGRSIDDHLVRISELWARFSEVAAANPSAWSRRAYTAEEIRTPGPDNRWIGFPYPKLMNSNNAVEQSAVVLLCSVEAAERAGVPRDRWVFPHAGTDAHDTYALSNRYSLDRSPGMRAAGHGALALAGVGTHDIAHIDLYSCFPSAVEMAADELGVAIDDPARPLTVTGGLTFAGGPWNNYVSHSIATMARVLRDDPGSIGLVSGNGGFITKHAFGVYSTEPPSAGFRWRDVQEEVDREPTREAVGEWDGPAELETWTVMHDRAGEPETAFAAVRVDGDRRAWASSREPAALKVLLAEDVAGATVHVAADGTLSL